MPIPLIILAGLNGCGKSTIGPLIATKFNFEFVESDTFHTEATTKLLVQGSLRAEDCGDLYDRCVEELSRVEKATSPRGIIFEAAALDRMRRNGLRKRIEVLKEQGSKLELLAFIFCFVEEKQSFNRVGQRLNHPAGLKQLIKNLSILEIPSWEGTRKEEDCVLLDCNGSVEENVVRGLSLLESCLIEFKKVL